MISHADPEMNGRSLRRRRVDSFTRFIYIISPVYQMYPFATFTIWCSASPRSKEHHREDLLDLECFIGEILTVDSNLEQLAVPYSPTLPYLQYLRF